VENIHKSQSCNYPKNGHKCEATKADKMGGSEANKEIFVGATYLNNREKFDDCRTPPLVENHETAIFESGCNGPFLLINAPCHNKVKSQSPLRVRLPNGNTMDYTYTAFLDIPELSQPASITHVFPVSMIDGATIYNCTENAILKAQRNLNTGLW
jgi:hypothetical protein